MPRVGLKFLDGPARQEPPVKHTLDTLPETWHIVFNGPDTDGKNTARSMERRPGEALPDRGHAGRGAVKSLRSLRLVNHVVEAFILPLFFSRLGATKRSGSVFNKKHIHRGLYGTG